MNKSPASPSHMSTTETPGKRPQRVIRAGGAAMMQCFPDQLTGFRGRRVAYFNLSRAMATGRAEVLAQLDTLDAHAAMGPLIKAARVL